MTDLFNKEKIFNQQDIAELLGLKSDRQIRNLMRAGVLPKAKGRDGLDPLACLHAYIRYKSASVDVLSPKGEGEDGEVDQKEREQLLKNDALEERIKLSRIKRVVLEKQYAPIGVITDTISQVAISLRTRVDSWLPKLKMVWPDIPMDAQEMFKREFAAALNELSEVEPNLISYEDSDIESGFASIDTIEGDDSNDRGGVGG